MKENNFINIQLFAKDELENEDGLDIDDIDFELDNDEEELLLDLEESDFDNEESEDTEENEYIELEDNNPSEDNTEEQNLKNDAFSELEILKKDLENERIKYDSFSQKSKEALSKLGINVEGSIEDIIDNLSAESEGLSLDEYRRQAIEQEEIEKARKFISQQKYKAEEIKDLTELRRHFPELLKVKQLKDCFQTNDEILRFGKLRELGLDAKEAFQAIGSTVRIQPLTNNNKNHIRAIAPKSAGSDVIVMPKAILSEWKELFPNKSDKELITLYKQTL